MFFHSFDELNMSNFVTTSAYDSRPVKELLDDKNKRLFGKKYPLFYNYKNIKNNGEIDYISAIDIALNENQFGAVTTIIDYVIKYQDSYIFSYLFRRNLV